MFKKVANFAKWLCRRCSRVKEHASCSALNVNLKPDDNGNLVPICEKVKETRQTSLGLPCISLRSADVVMTYDDLQNTWEIQNTSDVLHRV